MTTQPVQQYGQYKTDHEALLRSSTSHDALYTLRAKGMTSFEHHGFPVQTRDNEKWKHTNITPIARTAFTSPTPSSTLTKPDLRGLVPMHDDWATLVFVDGFYVESLSSPRLDGVRVSGIPDDLTNEPRIGTILNHESGGFTALNTAFLQNGALVNIPANSNSIGPVHVVFVTTEHSERIVTHPRTLVIVGANTELTLLESYVTLTSNEYFTNAVSEIVLEPGSKMDHYRYLMESSNAFHVGVIGGQQDRDSSFRSTAFAHGARIARNEVHVMLNAPGASCALGGLYFTNGTEHIDNHINIEHLQPHTVSDLYFKGILDGQSRAVFSGGVIVHPNAQKTVATQKDQNLLLSDGARINTKPMLEIYADDIQAAHGATAGAIADEAIYYMQSRGLSRETARRLLIQGYATEIIDRVDLDILHDHLEGLFSSETHSLNPLGRKKSVSI